RAGTIDSRGVRMFRAWGLEEVVESFGGVAAPPALGKAIELAGVRAVPLILCAISAVCLITTGWLIRAASPPVLPTSSPHRTSPSSDQPAPAAERTS
ncbi:hypothetical protein ACWEWX_15450, partial [Streptomyces asiaticus]